MIFPDKLSALGLQRTARIAPAQRDLPGGGGGFFLIRPVDKTQQTGLELGCAAR